MASAPNSSADNDNKHACQESLRNEKNRISNQIVSVLSESNYVWKKFSEKQMIRNKLCHEDSLVSDLFTKYRIICENRQYSLTQRIEFMEIDQEVQVLAQILLQFKTKLFKSNEIMDNLIRDMRAHICKLKSILETVIKSKSLEELSVVFVPTLDWIETVPDPEIDILADEWNQMQLQQKICYYLHQLELLLNWNP